MSLILKSKTLVLNVTDKVMYLCIYIFIYIYKTNEYTGDVLSTGKMQRSLSIILKQRNVTVSHFEKQEIVDNTSSSCNV